MPRIPRFVTLTVLLAAAATVWACSVSPKSRERAGATLPIPTIEEGSPRDYPGLHNTVAFHEDFISGSAPEGAAGFEALAAMGVRTIISVDGAEPDVAMAQARGMRYIHLPIGYNGFDEERRLQLARAARDAMSDGPVYIHCHHGKHRSAGAAAAIAASLGWQSAETGIGRMKVAGTAPNYTGLYSCAGNAAPVSMAMLDGVPADFPSVWKPSSYVKGMVEIDEALTNLKQIERAGWTTPREHPDLVPAAEAGRLADLHRLLIETEYTRRKPAEFIALMRDGGALAQRLEDLLVAGDADGAMLSAQLRSVAASCKACHARYRD